MDTGYLRKARKMYLSFAALTLSAGDGSSSVCLLLDTLVGTHRQEFVVLLVRFSRGFQFLLLLVDLAALALQSHRRHEPLDLWCFESRFLAFLLGGHFTADDVLAHIIFFAQVLSQATSASSSPRRDFFYKKKKKKIQRAFG